MYNGTGAETFAKGSTYHGEYAGGLRNGWGVCRFYNGDYYEGQWAKGLRDGSGMQQVGTCEASAGFDRRAQPAGLRFRVALPDAIRWGVGVHNSNALSMRWQGESSNTRLPRGAFSCLTCARR